MESREDSEEFQRSLEPMVIINDEDSDDTFEDDTEASKICEDPKEDPLMNEDIAKRELMNSIGPEISIIPVPLMKKKPSFKIRLFEREYSPSRDDSVGKVQSISRSPREKVRRVSHDEASSTEDTYNRRRSSPLEKCPICKKFFRRMKTHLLKHEMISRPLEDRLMCTFCQKAFNTPSNLAIHMRTHTGDKPYICEVCQKSFSQSCNLVNHMRVHTGEKPFKCPYCDRAFTQSGNLNNHIRLHTDEKPFKCHFCDKAFVQSGNLSSHIRNNHKYIDSSVESIMFHKAASAAAQMLYKNS